MAFAPRVALAPLTRDFDMTAFPWLKIAVVAVLFGLGVWTGHGLTYAPAFAAGKQAGVDLTDAKYAGALEQQRAQAAADFAEATANNAKLKTDYAALKAQWKVDHDLAEATKDDLSNKLRAAAARAGRMRDPAVLVATASRGGGGEAPAAAAAPGAGVGPDVSAAAGGLLREQLPAMLEFVAVKLRQADDVLTVANQCKAASELSSVLADASQ